MSRKLLTLESCLFSCLKYLTISHVCVQYPLVNKHIITCLCTLVVVLLATSYWFLARDSVDLSPVS